MQVYTIHTEFYLSLIIIICIAYYEEVIIPIYNLDYIDIVEYSDGKKITTMTMLDVRETIQKAMGNTKLKGYFNTLRAAFMTKSKKKSE